MSRTPHRPENGLLREVRATTLSWRRQEQRRQDRDLRIAALLQEAMQLVEEGQE